MKLFAALLALTLSLAGCGPVDGDPIRSGAAASDSASRPDAVTVAQLRQQAEQNGRPTWCSAIKEDVDAAIAASASFEQFLRQLRIPFFQLQVPFLLQLPHFLVFLRISLLHAHAQQMAVFYQALDHMGIDLLQIFFCLSLSLFNTLLQPFCLLRRDDTFLAHLLQSEFQMFHQLILIHRAQAAPMGMQMLVFQNLRMLYHLIGCFLGNFLQIGFRFRAEGPLKLRQSQVCLRKCER